jgi:hypothetical protein
MAGLRVKVKFSLGHIASLPMVPGGGEVEADSGGHPRSPSLPWPWEAASHSQLPPCVWLPSAVFLVLAHPLHFGGPMLGSLPFPSYVYSPWDR